MAKRVKVSFGDDETAWCVRLSATRARLDNILFLHETPALGDEIEIKGDPPRCVRIVKQSGRHTMILDYPGRADFAALKKRLKRELDVESEGCFAPKDGNYGRLYLALPKRVKPRAVYDAAKKHVPGVVGIHPRFGKLPPKPPPPPPEPMTLFVAVREGKTAIVERLLKDGADPNKDAPLLAAAMRNRPKEARLLIASGADPAKAKDKDGDPVVVVAAFRDNTAVLRVLLTTKPRQDVVSLALLEAAGNGNLTICKLLVKHGGDPQWRSKRGNSAYSIAVKRKHTVVVQYFRSL